MCKHGSECDPFANPALEPNITVGLTVCLFVHSSLKRSDWSQSSKTSKSTRKHLQTLSSKARLYTAHLKHCSSILRASLDMLLATSGHIPLSPAKVVKANTLQGGRSPLSSNPKDRKRKSSTTKRYWMIHTLYKRATHTFQESRVPCRVETAPFETSWLPSLW